MSGRAKANLLICFSRASHAAKACKFRLLRRPATVRETDSPFGSAFMVNKQKLRRFREESLGFV